MVHALVEELLALADLLQTISKISKNTNPRLSGLDPPRILTIASSVRLFLGSLALVRPSRLGTGSSDGAIATEAPATDSASCKSTALPHPQGRLRLTAASRAGYSNSD